MRRKLYLKIPKLLSEDERRDLSQKGKQLMSRGGLVTTVGLVGFILALVFLMPSKGSPPNGGAIVLLISTVLVSVLTSFFGAILFSLGWNRFFIANQGKITKFATGVDFEEKAPNEIEIDYEGSETR